MTLRTYYNLGEFIADYDGSVRVVIFGTGVWGERACYQLRDSNIEVECFTCNTRSRYGTEYCDTPVRSPGDISVEGIVFVIALANAQNILTVMRQLLDMGIKKEQMVFPLERLGSSHLDFCMIKIPEFLDGLKQVTLRRYFANKSAFCNYFQKNDLYSLTICGDGAAFGVEELLQDSGIKITYIDADCGEDALDGADAILIMDMERFWELEDLFLEKFELPIVNFWWINI